MPAPAATASALPTPPISPKGRDIVIVLTFLYAISLVMIVLRFVAKYRVKSIGLEDWASLAAFTCLTVYYGETMYILVYCYAGFHILQLEIWQIEKFLKYAYANNIVYAITLPIVKLSILAMYWRLFTVSLMFNRALVGVSIIVVGWMISVTIAQIFTCTPIQDAWNVTTPANCFDQKNFYYGNAISNVITDVIILMMPIPLVWHLNMSTRKKLNVTLLFFLGGFVCISSVLRITTFAQLDWKDITYTLVNVAIWTAVETPLAYICSNLPLLPLIVKMWTKDANKKHSRATTGSSYKDIESHSSIPLNSIGTHKQNH